MSDEQTRKLPLWKNCIDVMQAQGVEFGKLYPAEFFEAELAEPVGSVGYNMGIFYIRRALQRNGFHLSGEGHNGRAYEIIPAADNHLIIRRYLRVARDRTERAVILGAATPLDRLTPSEQLRHEQTLERAQTRLALMRRETDIKALVQRTAPNLLKSLG